MSYKKGDKLQVEVEKLSFGGAGIAKHEGIVIFVSDSAPGDLVTVELTKVKKRYCEAKLLEIHSSGSSRRVPPCPVATECGGCQWQHIEYPEQLAQKQLILAEQFSRSKTLSDIEIPPLIAHQEFRYRNRIQLKIQGSEFGFYQKKTNSLVPIKDCLISEAELFEELKKHPKKVSESSRVEIFRTETGELDFSWDSRAGAGHGFSQVNTQLNKQMIQWVSDHFRSSSSTVFYDLYAGNGNFSRNVASEKPRAQYHAVELNSQATKIGKDLTPPEVNIKWHNQKVESYLKSERIQENAFVLIDPPRTGCDSSVIEAISSSRINELFYISCNPTTFIRDIELLSATRQLKVKELKALDMFPNTYHIELMAKIELEPKL